MTQQYIVITEADGSKPSASFYERRSKLALKVRTKDLDLTATPMVRRGLGQNLGTIIQEGVCITSSYSQAKLVAELAQAYGIKVIFFGQAEIAAYEATEEDRTAFERVNKVLSQRGRKPEPELHTVTCWEEMTTWELTASEVLLCPACSGTNISTRLGHATRVRPPGIDENIPAYWLASRFPAGVFEIPVPDDTCTTLPVLLGPTEDAEQTLVSRILSGMVGEVLAKISLTPKSQLDLLDAVFAARTRWPQVARDQTRAQAMIAWVRRFGGGMDFPLIEDETPDVFDAAGILGIERCLNIYRALTMEKTL